jgi:hypothetical protein
MRNCSLVDMPFAAAGCNQPNCWTKKQKVKRHCACSVTWFKLALWMQGSCFAYKGNKVQQFRCLLGRNRGNYNHCYTTVNNRLCLVFCCAVRQLSQGKHIVARTTNNKNMRSAVAWFMPKRCSYIKAFLLLNKKKVSLLLSQGVKCVCVWKLSWRLDCLPIKATLFAIRTAMF